MVELRMHASVSRRVLAQAHVRELLARVVAKAAFDVEAQAKARVPVDTGALKNSIQAHPRTALEWEIAVGMEYGPHVEYGTVNAGAQPYLTPAVEAVRPGFLAAIDRVVQRGE